MPGNKKKKKSKKKSYMTAEAATRSDFAPNMLDRFEKARPYQNSPDKEPVRPAMLELEVPEPNELINPRRPGTDRCSKPSCSMCQARRNQELVELPKLYTGLRVTIRGLPRDRSNAGTVIQVPNTYVPKNHTAVCFDAPNELADSSLAELTGRGYGGFIPNDLLSINDDQQSYKAFQDIPSHIGVTVTEDARCDDVIFKSGVTGRLVRQSQMAGGRILVNWNFNHKAFYDAATQHINRSLAGRYTHCYNVPRSMLAFCRLTNSSPRQVAIIWPNAGSEGNESNNFQKGEYVKVLVADAPQVTNGIRRFRIAPGTIMVYQGPVDRHKSQVVLVGGCDPAILGLTAVIGTKALEKFEGDFISEGTEVEITASITFRKQDLKGLRAVVVLPLDQDGEVGLQFRKDIEAGSLDGHGQAKRCLYIHHSTIKRVSG